MGAKPNYGKGLYDQLQEVMARLDSVEKANKEETVQLKEDISVLKKENLELREENQLLRNDNARLKSIINHDSSNTSAPPSSDPKGGKAANTYNGREQTKKKSGGQKGHKGTTLTKADAEEKIRSGQYRHRFVEMGDPQSRKYLTKYVLDVEVTPVITEVRIYADEQGKYQIPGEYHSDVTYGDQIKAMAVALYSEGVMSNSRIAVFLNAIVNGELGLSEGSIYGFCKKFAKRAEPEIARLEAGLLNQPAAATDATVATVNGKQNYIRNFSVEDTVVYEAMEKKSIPALKEVPFLKRYTGILVHDHETALYHFGTGHAECNVHLLRYLRKNTEESGNEWSGKMAGLLCEMNEERKKAKGCGEGKFSREKVKDYGNRYEQLLSEGRTQNKTTKHKYAKAEEKSYGTGWKNTRKTICCFWKISQSPLMTI